MLDFDDILIKLPSLKNLLDTHGSMSLFDYAKEHYHGVHSDSPVFQSRKEEFLSFLRDYVAQRHGVEMAEIVVSTLSKNYAVSTAEHHGPMGHPFFFQSALLRAITQPQFPVVNFATSHVSLGNSSYPRGLVFHGDGEEAPKEYLHLPFFSSKLRMCPVFRLPAYTQEDIEEHCLQRLQKYHREHIISDKLYENILVFIRRHVLNPATLVLPTYSEQVTRLNHGWWKELFPELSPYISLDAEDMVVELLQIHLQENTFFSRLLTDLSLQFDIEEHFDGISCCFQRNTRRGTYLFWYLDAQNKRHALWREGDELVSVDKSFRMKMISAEYQYHFSRHHLIPSGLLVYSLLACHYGVTCFGGFAQGEYLSRIQAAFKKIAGASENLSTQSSILNEDMVFLFQDDGEISTAVDVYSMVDKKFNSIAPENIQIKDSIYKMEYEISRCF